MYTPPNNHQPTAICLFVQQTVVCLFKSRACTRRTSLAATYAQACPENAGTTSLQCISHSQQSHGGVCAGCSGVVAVSAKGGRVRAIKPWCGQAVGPFFSAWAGGQSLLVFWAVCIKSNKIKYLHRSYKTCADLCTGLSQFFRDKTPVCGGLWACLAWHLPVEQAIC